MNLGSTGPGRGEGSFILAELRKGPFRDQSLIGGVELGRVAAVPSVPETPASVTCLSWLIASVWERRVVLARISREIKFHVGPCVLGALRR